ncbi:MAG TPA: molybdopterin cofactor-binding domain-containing protein [Syntrophales bacterium]|nr:molybdopterin cofactor-binding domain-containing protein [Syntrophales bacterium]
MEKYSVIGKSLPRVDAVVKVTGDAKYTADMMLPGMLYGKILRSPHPHAKILNIDVSKAKRLPGVRAVITGNDTPGKTFGRYQDDPLRQQFVDQYALAIDKVRYIGDEVAAVAAIDEDTAEEALDLIDVEYEELPAVFDPEEAMKPGAPRIHDHAEHNVGLILPRHFGDVEKGFKESDHIFEDRFVTQGVTHCALEPHAVLASFDPAGKLTVWSSNQNPFPDRAQLARALDMPEGRVRIIKPHVGGGFGGKVELLSHDVCSSLLSMKTGRPVMIVLTREEVFNATRQRHPMIIKLKTGVKSDGTLMAKECTIISDTGAYYALGPNVMAVTGYVFMLIYRVPNVRYEANLVFTNKQVCGAQRGYGNPQIRFADDSQMDMIAEALAIDPVELRLKNAAQPGDITSMGARITSCGFTECLQKVMERTGWRDKRGKLPGNQGIGMAGQGMVSGAKTYDRPFSSGALVELQEDGTIILFTGGADIGQGLNTVLSQITAEVLGVGIEDIRIVAADTEITPWDQGTSSSRATMFAGNAVKLAASDARRQLFEAVAERLEANPEDLEARDRKIFVKGSPEKGISFSDAVLAIRLNKKQPLLGRGYYDPDVERPSPTGKGNVSPSYSFGADVAEVEVDTETGRVKVSKITGAHDCGFALNPMAVDGQVEGATHMGVGYVLTEGFFREEGQTLNSSFLGHKMLTALDMPEVESMIVEPIDPQGPFGAKEVGEGTSVATAPAIANAIYDAIGVRIKDLPITPEKILKALEEKD